MTSLTASGLDLNQLFPFNLDDFQIQAIAALELGSSVVVCAPTGSGKTLIGEYAIHRAIARGRRVFYTTPLKALSNQKLRDFREMFGFDQVGLLTGDISINRDAPVLVMTTEIFRNMLYGTPIGEVGTSLTGVEAVVLDECHYMNDRQRGTVWEESIIYCPPEIQLVALSATVANSDQLTDWIHQVHGPTELIYSDFRPVPLSFHFCTPKGLFPLLDDSQKRIHPRLKPKGGKMTGRMGGSQRSPKQDSPSLAYLVSQLQQRDMLPAIYFIFSRRNCDQAIEQVRHLSLVNANEAAQLKQQIDDFLERNPEAGRAGQVEPLYNGIAAHHAGILPAWKGLVEELFQQGLIKVVFATETLAAGINMPARTTVISSLSKRTDLGHRLLNASEFLQMAGRAGRRGMDVQGYVVTAQTQFEGAREASHLATAAADPLVSQFTPSYGMVLNLLQTHSLEETQALIERSFGQYLSTLYLRPQQEAIAQLDAELAQINAQIEEVDWNLLGQYEKLQERLKEERRLLKILQQQANEVRATDMGMALSFAVAGTIISLKSTQNGISHLMAAVLVMKTAGSGQFPYLICLGKDNRWYVATVSDVAELRGEIPRMAGVDDLTPPPDMLPKPGQTRKGDEQTEAIAQKIPPAPDLADHAPEVHTQQQRMQGVEAEMQAHPVHQWGNRATIQKRQKRMTAIRDELSDRRDKLNHQAHRYWEAFLDLIDILREFGCLDDLIPTPLGQSTAAIRGDNELWLGLALTSGELGALAPHHLATACAALITEPPRPDAWTRYPIPGEVEEALNGLRSIRQRLFQRQRRLQVVLPAWLEYESVGIVEQWALGIEWKEICANTSQDEGDVVRILRRTLDFLSQIPHVPYLPNELKRNAVRAIQLIDRFPVSGAVE